MPLGCDSARKGTSALAPGNQAEWWDSPNQGNMGRNKDSFKSAVPLLWKVTVFPYLMRKLPLFFILHIWVLHGPLVIQLNCCAPPLNRQSQRQLPAGQHSKFTALTPRFDNTKPNASAKFQIAILLTFLSPNQLSAELQREGGESQWQTHSRALKSTCSFNLWCSWHQAADCLPHKGHILNFVPVGTNPGRSSIIYVSKLI